MALAPAERYHQSGGLESAFTFAVEPDTSYDVVCGRPGEAGSYGVAQVAPLPRVPLGASDPTGAHQVKFSDTSRELDPVEDEDEG